MSIDLSIIYYPKDGAFSAKDNFIAIVDGITSWPQFAGGWSGFSWDESPARCNTYVRDVSSTEHLLQLVAKCGGDPRASFSVWAESTYWHRTGALHEFERQPMSMLVRAWGPENYIFPDGDLNVEGMASVSILAKPYWAIVADEYSEEERHFNEKVSENLDELLDLFRRTALQVQPESARIVVDEGWSFPWNSHCTYFANENAVLRDLQTMRQMWSTGLWYERGHPMSEYNPKRHSFSLSHLRSDSQRASLWNELNTFLPEIDKVGVRTIRAAKQLANDMHVVGVRDGWFMAYGRPHYLNAFIVDFYLAALEIATWPESDLPDGGE